MSHSQLLAVAADWSYDLMDVLGDCGAAPKLSLQETSAAVGLPGRAGHSSCRTTSRPMRCIATARDRISLRRDKLAPGLLAVLLALGATAAQRIRKKPPAASGDT